MSLSRRRFMGVAATGAAMTLNAMPRSTGVPVKLVAFDGFPIIDARPVGKLAEALFPGRGEEFMNTWRTRQFEYCWLRTLSRRYQDFWHTTQDALTFAARALKLPLPDSTRDRLMSSWLELTAWPDARPALEKLRENGIRAVFLSNFTAQMLESATRNSGLESLMRAPLSTDRVHAFKPDPRAYAMALDAFGVERESVVFCAGAGWDAAGARAFGYRTFWLNRNAQPSEELGEHANEMGTNLEELTRFVLGAPAA